MNEVQKEFEVLKKETFVSQAIEKYGEEKMQKVFLRAWDEGHSYGSHGIKSKMMDFIDILDC